MMGFLSPTTLANIFDVEKMKEKCEKLISNYFSILTRKALTMKRRRQIWKKQNRRA